ncbi:putative bifunctional diguanylate cyclase/phosphodiesterase [Citrifermentans bremense]|uniref:putative bifunctional diguanylate cyclase/phosphodiesterase n=1 Tax=Citrifermentans bremense TaxID=60035 RepID=UPI0003F85868|nr:EAL domain-containing protein [Citrifermentans bremense]
MGRVGIRRLFSWIGGLSPAAISSIFAFSSLSWLLLAHLLFRSIFVDRELTYLALSILELFGVATMTVIVYLLTEKSEARHRAIELSIREQTIRDGLTGLYNRQAFDDFLAQSIEYAKRRRESVALLFLDLDRFKFVNDRRGHFVGDAVLIETARRLTDCAKRGEDLVARVGGDEFAMLLRHPDMPDGPGVVARRVLESLSAPVQVDGETLKTSVSIGIAMFPSDADDPMQLFKMADFALNQAKQQGRATFCFYGGEWREERDHTLQLEQGLLRAINYDELFLVYQPKLDTSNMRVIGVEALVRWKHPHLGVLGPASFVPVAEKAGLIWPLTEWVLKSACSQAARWYRNEGLDLNVAVNLSPSVFSHQDLEEVIEKALNDSNLPPDRLTLEITEQSLMIYETEALGVLERLQRMGTNIQIDDFGTGYSSLSSLKHYHFQALKIDKSFVSDVVTSSDDAAIATTIMFMSKCLDMEAIAEGVESEAQKEFLASIDCRYMQGFYFSRPLAASEMADFIRHLADDKKA